MNTNVVQESIHVRFDKTVRTFPPRKQFAWINLRDGQHYEVGHWSIPECWRILPFIRGVAFKLATAIHRVGDSVIIDAFTPDANGKAYVNEARTAAVRQRFAVPFKVFKLRAWYDGCEYST